MAITERHYEGRVMSEHGFTRRHFFFGALLAGAIPAGGFGSTPSLRALGYKSPNEKLNLASIGAGGMALTDLELAEAGVENVVALADCDWKRAEKGFAKYPKAAKYKDFRKMLDKSGKDIDAVLVGTPEHSHTLHALACMQMGKHVYLEKPLSRTPWEARLLTQAAEKYNVATQLGNQGYSHEATRVAAEIIWSGEIGDVTEVHGWRGKATCPMGMQKIPAPTPVPETLDWDVWLGGAAWRKYTAGDDEYRQHAAADMTPPPGYGWDPSYGFYLPWNWRGFYDFGAHMSGHEGVHVFGPAYWGLQLHPRHLISVEVMNKEGTSPFMFSRRSMVRWEFGPRGNMPPVTVYWQEGDPNSGYLPPGMTAEEARKIPGQGPQIGPPSGYGNSPVTGYTCIFVGTKGFMGTSGRGEGVGLLPGSRWAEYKLPNAYLPRSPGSGTDDNQASHCRDWVRACKSGAPACSNFSVSGPYSEWNALGTAACHFEGKLLWNYEKMEFTNNKDASQLLKPTFRKGWEMKL